ncbi:MAG: fasciclin domain-containing protein, partial [Prosthecobacter sp.]
MIKKLVFTSLLGLVASAALAADNVIAAKPDTDIIATAKTAGIFKTLVAALDAADKTKMLKEGGPFT